MAYTAFVSLLFAGACAGSLFIIISMTLAYLPRMREALRLIAPHGYVASVPPYSYVDPYADAVREARLTRRPVLAYSAASPGATSDATRVRWTSFA